MKALKRIFAGWGWYKPRAIDPQNGGGRIWCSIYKNEIKIVCPNVFATWCEKCAVTVW
jgi:hypothetical protein